MNALVALVLGLPPYDADWVNSTEHSNRDTRNVLEGRLSTAQSRLHKDAIRTAYLALAEYDIRTGRDNHTSPASLLGKSNNEADVAVGAAAVAKNHKENIINVHNYLYRAMDCCTSRIQTAQIGLLVIEAALNAGDYFTVKEYTGRVESTLHSLRDKIGAGATSGGDSAIHGHSKDPNQDAILRDVGVKVQIAKGIERMISGDYQKAANVFVSLVMKGSEGGESNNNNNTNNSNNENYPYQQSSNEHHTLHWFGVTAPEDVAFYAGLMCLVTRDRSKMMALADHPDALELVPSVKELLIHWSRANYAPCMRALSVGSGTDNSHSSSSSSSLADSLSQPLLPMGRAVDVYLTPSRWEALVQTLRETCLIEYLRPYQNVKLEGLRDLFFPSSSTTDDNDNALDALVDILADLMDRELLPSTTRLDCREGVLFQTEAPTDPAPNLQAVEEKILDDTHAMLVRLACLEHDLGSSSIDVTALGGKRGKKGQKGGRRYPRRGKSNRDSVGSSSDDDEDINGDDNDGVYEAQVENAGAGGDGWDTNDTHMIDTESSQINSAMNPEDMY